MAGVTGTLRPVPALSRPDLLADPVAAALRGWSWADEVKVAEIDPELADTAAFCEAYQVGPDVSANCVVVAGKREGQVRYAACLVLATTRADVNGVVRRQLDVRKASFAPMDTAVAETGMQYGGGSPPRRAPPRPGPRDAPAGRAPGGGIRPPPRGGKPAPPRKAPAARPPAP